MSCNLVTADTRPRLHIEIESPALPDYLATELLEWLNRAMGSAIDVLLERNSDIALDVKISEVRNRVIRL